MECSIPGERTGAYKNLRRTEAGKIKQKQIRNVVRSVSGEPRQHLRTEVGVNSLSLRSCRCSMLMSRGESTRK